MKTAISLIAVLVIIGGGWWILNQDKGADLNSGMPVPGTNTVETVVNEPAATGAIKEFTINGGKFYFNPKTMTVNKGDTVKITFVNLDGIHDLVIDEFNVRTEKLEAGKSQEITFVADKSGTFEYYCSVGTHRQMGMVGALTVK